MSRAARRTWLVVGSIVTVAMIASATLQIVELVGQNTVEVDRKFAASAVDRLLVEVQSGSVEVRGTDAATTTVTGTVRSGLGTASHEEVVEDGRLAVRVDCPSVLLSGRCDADLVIEVPEDTAVAVHSTNTTVTLSGIRARVDVRTTDGGVRADRIETAAPVELVSSNADIEVKAMATPQLSLRTSNSSIRAELAVDPVHVRVRSSNGSADVVVPDTEVAYDVTLETSNGAQEIGVRTDPASDRRIDVRTSNGDATVTYPG
jgi:DUF4097 and DUF4098 domain-containing protein YvlB